MAVNACASVQRSGPAIQARPWRTYLGSDERSGGGTDSVGPDPRPVWRTDVGRGITGSPALTEDLVIVAMVDRQLALLDRPTGDVLWRRRLPNSPGAGPLADGDRILVATQEENGRVYAMQLATGARIWSAPAGDVAAPLALDDSTVYAATTTGDVLALRTTDGTKVWRTRLAGAVRAAPLPTAAGLVVATTADSVFLLHAGSGRILARTAARGSVLAPPTLAGPLVIVGTSAGEVLALRTDSLVPEWRLDLGGPVAGTVAVRDGTAFALTARGTLWRIPLASPTGAEHVETGVVTRAGPIPTPSGVFVASIEGEILLVDPATGARRWSAQVQTPLEEPPLVDGRFILAAAVRGLVVAFR